MKAKVIIENGETTIELTTQNDFEIDLIEKVENQKGKFVIQTDFSCKKRMGFPEGHKITMTIKEIRP